MISAFRLFGIGIILGIANVIPGVSGGTMAVVFGVYDRLIAVITPQIKKILSAWKFWLPLGAGLVAGILLFARFVTWAFEHYPAPVRCFFTGIILGSLPLIFFKARSVSNCNMGGGWGIIEAAKLPAPSSLIAAAVTFALMIVMAVTTPEENRLLFSSISAGLVTFLFFAGALAAAAMIIPGVSGSFLLLALGVYYPVVSAVSDLLDAAVLFLRGGYPDTGALLADIALSFFTLLPFGVGVIAGLFTGAALVRLVLRKAAAVTYGAILGLVAGSVAVVFPREGFDGAFLVIFSLACGLAGGALSFLFSRRELTAAS